MPMIYFKPLLRGRPRPIATTQTKLLHRLGEYTIEEIRHEIDRSGLKSKKNIKNSLKYKVGPSSVTIWSDHPAFEFIEKGVKPHDMRYVKNKPVPMDPDDMHHPTLRDRLRRIGFRTLEGVHKHPGIKAHHFARKGIKAARARLASEITSAAMMT